MFAIPNDPKKWCNIKQFSNSLKTYGYAQSYMEKVGSDLQ